MQLSRSLGTAFGAASAGAAQFGIVTLVDGDAAGLFTRMVRYGPVTLDSLDPIRRTLFLHDGATGFRGVSLTVACFSRTIVACAATLPIRRL